jgi:hypothetical protein
MFLRPVMLRRTRRTGAQPGRGAPFRAVAAGNADEVVRESGPALEGVRNPPADAVRAVAGCGGNGECGKRREEAGRLASAVEGGVAAYGVAAATAAAAAAAAAAAVGLLGLVTATGRREGEGGGLSLGRALR